MPAPVVVIHQEPAAREALLAAVRALGVEAAGYADPLKALDAVDADSRARVVVTKIDLGESKLNGVALARMLRLKQSRIRVLLIGDSQFARLAQTVGEFFPPPLDPQSIAAAVARCMAML